MNYRHAFHAGNFADLVKHAVLLAVLERLQADGAPLTVIDTHAGAGAYRLDDPAARRSGEAQAGVTRLMAADAPPPGLKALAQAVQRFNDGAGLTVYPGSPPLIFDRLGMAGLYLGCELRPDDYALLRTTLRPWAERAEVLQTDGYDEAARRLKGGGGRTLVLVDPPFERADDYARAADLVSARSHPFRQPMLIWTPLKDLETFDAFLGRVEAAGPASLATLEVRLRPLDDPMRLNGCAMVLVDAPDVSQVALEVGCWVARELGEADGGARWLDLTGSAS